MSEKDDNRMEFFACIPHEIQAEWDAKYAPLLAGFPWNLMFIRIRKPKNGEGSLQIVSSLYEFDLSTFRESRDKRQMTYRSPANCEYRVEVAIYREKLVIEVSNFSGTQPALAGERASPERVPSRGERALCSKLSYFAFFAHYAAMAGN
jgi:hypothetical protein